MPDSISTATTRERALEAALRLYVIPGEAKAKLSADPLVRQRQRFDQASAALALPTDAPPAAPVATGEHTPGPWKIDELMGTRCVMGRSPFGKTLPNATGRMVIANPAPYSKEHRAEREATLRLIAAAPDMLATLQTKLANIEAAASASGDDVSAIDADYDIIRAAIARATGRAA